MRPGGDRPDHPVSAAVSSVAPSQSALNGGSLGLSTLAGVKESGPVGDTIVLGEVGTNVAPPPNCCAAAPPSVKKMAVAAPNASLTGSG